MKARALVLMSGGLDSILAAKLLANQGIDITLVCFKSYFFSCDSAKRASEVVGLPLRVEDISLEHLNVVKHPRHGYGASINPCIDCHLLMLKTAREIMEREGFDFVATGEVLGERPMSQNQRALDLIEKESGLGGRLLRPLSAKILPPTMAENQGLVKREKLGDVSGRSRKEQLRLAEQFGIKDIPQPGGGCILTEKEYGERIKKMKQVNPFFDGSDVLVMRYCRPIWEGEILIAIARDSADCRKLSELVKPGDHLFNPENFPGPTVLVRSFSKVADNEKIKTLGNEYLLRYSKKIPVDPLIKEIKI